MSPKNALCCLVLVFAWSADVAAAGLAAPSGRVLLSITGAIERTNVDGRADFDRAMLEGLGMVEIETSTPFTEGVSVWRGVPAAALFEAVGARGGSVRAVASNDYAVAIPVDSLVDDGAVIALYRDGEPLRRRSKGPLWITFPWDDLGALLVEEFKHYSVWSVRELNFE